MIQDTHTSIELSIKKEDNNMQLNSVDDIRYASKTMLHLLYAEQEEFMSLHIRKPETWSEEYFKRIIGKCIILSHFKPHNLL